MLLFVKLILFLHLGKLIESTRIAIQYSGLLNDFLTVENIENHLNVSHMCQMELEVVRNGLIEKDVWAMKLMDASGHVGSGFVWGNNYWLGSEMACRRVDSPVQVVLSQHLHKNHIQNLTEIPSPMPVDYKIVWAKHHSKWQLDINTFDKAMVHIGLCIPKSCSAYEVDAIVEEMLRSNLFQEKYIVNGTFTVIKAKALELRSDFYSNRIVNLFMWVLICNLILVCVGTIYMKISQSKQLLFPESLKTSKNSETKAKSNAKKEGKSLAFIFFSSFCLIKNSNIITTNHLGRDSIEPIHGMRALGMVWIISGHLFFYGPAAIDNLQMVLTYAESWYLQPLFAVAMSVDTYFVISGLILSYLFFQTEKRQEKGHPVLKFASSVINRYMRLTPPYLVVLTLTGLVSIYLRDMSPYWMTEANDINCSKYWWRNVLYIQNLYPMEEMCMSWSWYLAVDFQCFVLVTFLLAVYTRLPTLAMTAFGIIFIATSSYVGYLSQVLSYSLSLDIQYSTIDYLYTPTYTRIGPYFIGVYAGWFLSQYERKLNISKKYLTLGWIIGPCLNLTMMFGNTKKELTAVGALIFTVFGKITWAIGIAWMIIACATGRGGIVNRVLSAECLLPFSRMSYTAYLINPLVITYTAMSAEAAIHLDFLTLLIYCLGFQMIVFTLAYLFMLIFENPFIRLGKLLQGK